MKRFLTALLCLVILLSTTVVSAETQEEKEFQWGAYILKATWLTTDPKEINISNMREDGLFIMVRLYGVGTPVYFEDIKAIEKNEFTLIDAEKNEYGISTWLVHKLIKPEGGGFPTTAPEQELYHPLKSELRQ